MRKNVMAVGAAAILIALASPASAQGMGPGRGLGGMGMGTGMWQALVGKLCAKDIETHCKSEEGPGARACLESKSKDLSENCRLALESTGPDRGRGTGPVATLCMNEISKFCPEVEHAFGQVRNCLNAHSGDLGEGCTIALENTGPRWHN